MLVRAECICICIILYCMCCVCTYISFGTMYTLCMTLFQLTSLSHVHSISTTRRISAAPPHLLTLLVLVLVVVVTLCLLLHHRVAYVLQLVVAVVVVISVQVHQQLYQICVSCFLISHLILSLATASISSATSAHTIYMRAVRRHAELHGASVATSLHSGVSHVVLRPDQLQRLGNIRVSVYLLNVVLFPAVDKFMRFAGLSCLFAINVL